jgi:hypothetical protein
VGGDARRDCSHRRVRRKPGSRHQKEVLLSRVTRFEQELIDAALVRQGADIPPGAALVLMPDSVEFLQIFDQAVSPSLVDCGFRVAGGLAFDSHSWVSDVVRLILGVEVIVADVTNLNPDVMYVLGLCHGVGRCPILLSQDAEALPFNLDILRCIRYAPDAKGSDELRNRLSRAIRVFRIQAAASWEKPKG